MRVVFGFDDGEGLVGFVEQNDVGAFGSIGNARAPGSSFGGDAIRGEDVFLAEQIIGPAAASASKSGQDKLGDDICFAEVFLVHGRARTAAWYGMLQAGPRRMFVRLIRGVNEPQAELPQRATPTAASAHAMVEVHRGAC
ncbi:MAG TPA: hypothetical protein PK156_42990, partial [Polyangium sp.]|nr:hypothetical protein [Polyangium sp.]